jgi:hypothetical protein
MGDFSMCGGGALSPQRVSPRGVNSRISIFVQQLLQYICSAVLRPVGKLNWETIYRYNIRRDARVTRFVITGFAILADQVQKPSYLEALF